MVANRARLVACFLVALHTRLIFCRNLYFPAEQGSVVSAYQLDQCRLHSRFAGGRADVRSRSEEEDHPKRRAVLASQHSWTRIYCGLQAHQSVYLHQRMRKPDLCSVDGAVAGSLDERQQVVVSRVKRNALQGSLHGSRAAAPNVSVQFSNLLFQSSKLRQY